jgi:hypothetical protein
MLKLFVYGTVKRGYWNHDRFCRGVLDIQEAKVRSRLYEMSSGIPVLQVPDKDILAHGTADPLADVAKQARFSDQMASYLEPIPESATGGDWAPVYGELLTFDDPEFRLSSGHGPPRGIPSRWTHPLQTGSRSGMCQKKDRPSVDVCE